MSGELIVAGGMIASAVCLWLGMRRKYHRIVMELIRAHAGALQAERGRVAQVLNDERGMLDKIIRRNSKLSFHRDESRRDFFITVRIRGDMLMSICHPSDGEYIMRYFCDELAHSMRRQLATINFADLNNLCNEAEQRQLNAKRPLAPWDGKEVSDGN